MFRWGIVGTGIVARKFVLGLRNAPGGVATACYSRDPNGRERFAVDFDLTPAASLADLIAAVDIVYIATPPASHRELALACFAARKPVLIEKPMAATLEDTRAITDAARAAQTFCMEGAWTRFLPIYAEVRRLLQRGAIGEVRSLSGAFGLSNIPDRADSQFDRSAGGGALLHRGHYPLAIATDLLGPAKMVAAAATIGDTGVDEDVTIVLRHHSGPLATLRASLRTELSNDIIIEGTAGRIIVQGPVYRPFRLRVIRSPAMARGGARSRFESLRESGIVQGLQQRLRHLVPVAKAKINAHYSGNGYGHEADAIMAAVACGDVEHPFMTLADSESIAALIEDTKSRCGIKN